MSQLQILADKLRLTYIKEGGATVSAHFVHWNNLAPTVKERWIEVAREALRFQGQDIGETLITVPPGCTITIIHKGIDETRPLQPTDVGVADLKAKSAPAADIHRTPSPQDMTKASNILGVIIKEFDEHSLLGPSWEAKVRNLTEQVKDLIEGRNQ